MTTAAIVRALRGAGRLALAAFREWIADRCEGLAAALAFNALLAVVPFVAVVLVLSASVLGESWTERHLAPVILGWVGPHGVAVLRFLTVQVEQIEPEALATLGVVSLVGLVVGASGYFLQMQDSLETVWDVRREIARVPAQLRKRALGLVYAGASAVVTLAGFLAASGVWAAGGVGPRHALADEGRRAAEALVAFLTFWALMSFWLKVLPPVRLSWAQVLPWAGLIAGLHLLGRLVLTWRAARQGPQAASDVAAALILVLLWLYYAHLVFLYGAELMRVSLQRSGQVLPAGPAPGHTSAG